MKKTLFQAGIILAIACVLAVLSAFFHPKAPAWYATEITDPMAFSPVELKQKLGSSVDSVVWVDARKSEDYMKEHMEGAILLNKENWETLVAENIEVLGAARGKPIVVYCDGTRCLRSSETAELLRQAVGLDPVYVLKGDWRKWLD